jgi:hypothetical protein
MTTKDREGEGQSRGFKVTDRRSFAGDAKPGDEAASAPPQGSGAEPAAGAAAATAAEAAAEAALPEIDFATFIISLATSAFYHLGQMPHPETQQPEVNLPLAKQTIDILGVLQGKTRGNLSRDEEKLLENLLYDLRLKYVELAKQ